MKGFYLRYIGRRRNAAAIGLINLIYPATAGARATNPDSESGLPRTAACLRAPHRQA